jgi:hypothetical protein
MAFKRVIIRRVGPLSWLLGTMLFGILRQPLMLVVIGVLFALLSWGSALHVGSTKGIVIGVLIGLSAILLHSILNFRKILQWSGYQGTELQLRSGLPFDLSWPVSLSAPLVIAVLAYQHLAKLGILPGLFAWSATVLLSMAVILLLFVAAAEIRWSSRA